MSSFGFEAAKQMPYYFISYSHTAAERIRPVVHALHEAGIPLWYDDGIDKRSSWDRTLQNKIRDCSLFLLFFDSSMITRGEAAFAREEFAYLTKECGRSEHQVLPVFLDPFDEEMKKEDSWAEKISHLQGIETAGKTPEEIAEEIISSIGKITKEDILDWLSVKKNSRNTTDDTGIDEEILPSFLNPSDETVRISDLCGMLEEGSCRISLTGEGGGGKTTAVRKICSSYAKNENHFVLFVPVKECTDGLFRYLHQEMDHSLHRKTDEDTFQSSFLLLVSEREKDERILIVFDGINEADSRTLNEEIGSVLEAAESHVSFIVSSRMKPDYHLYKDFAGYSTEILSKEKIRKYLKELAPKEDAAVWTSLSNPQVLWMYRQVALKDMNNQLRDGADVMNQYFEDRKAENMTSLEKFVYEYILPELVCRYDSKKIEEQLVYDENMILKISYVRSAADDVLALFADFAAMQEEDISDRYAELNKDNLMKMIMKICKDMSLGRSRKDGTLIWTHENYRDFFIAKGLYHRRRISCVYEEYPELWENCMDAMHRGHKRFSANNTSQENEYIYSQIRKKEFLSGLLNNDPDFVCEDDLSYALMMADLVSELDSNDYYWKIEPVAEEACRRLLRLVYDPDRQEKRSIINACEFTAYCAFRSFPAKLLDQKLIRKETDLAEDTLLQCKAYMEKTTITETEDQILYGKILSNLGACLQERYQSTGNEKDIKQAVNYHSASLEWRTELKNRLAGTAREVEIERSVAVSLNNLASDYYQWKRLDESVRYHCKALKIRRSLNTAVRSSETNLCGALLEMFLNGDPADDELLHAVKSVMPAKVVTENRNIADMITDFALYQFEADIEELKKQLHRSHPNIKRLTYLPDDYQKLYEIMKRQKIIDPERIMRFRRICSEIRNIARDVSVNIDIEEYESNMTVTHLLCPPVSGGAELQKKEFRRNLENWISTEAFTDLVNLFLKEKEHSEEVWKPSGNAEEDLRKLKEFTGRQWNFRNGRERTTIQDTEFTSGHYRQIINDVQALGLLDNAVSDDMIPDYILILGGINSSNDIRVKLGEDIYRKLNRPDIAVLGLSTKRELQRAEYEGFTRYFAPEAETEFDAVDASMAKYFSSVSYEDRDAEDNVSQPNIHQHRICRKHVCSDGTVCYTLCAPCYHSDAPEARANSADTLRYFKEVMNPAEGSRILEIGAAIYSSYQVTASFKAAQNYGWSVNYLGTVPDDTDHLSPAKYLQEIHATIETACRMLDEGIL